MTSLNKHELSLKQTKTKKHHHQRNKQTDKKGETRLQKSLAPSTCITAVGRLLQKTSASDGGESPQHSEAVDPVAGEELQGLQGLEPVEGREGQEQVVAVAAIGGR